MKTLNKLAFAACVAAAGFTTSANATLIGDTITATGASISPGSAVIGTGNEFSISSSIFFDFAASTLTITTPSGSFAYGNLGNIVFSGFDDTITNVSFASEQNFGTTAKNDFVNDLTFGPHSITFKLDGGTTQNRNSSLVFNITSTPAVVTPPVTVPEPATVALLGLGLLGFAASRRKAAKNKNA